MAVLIVNGRKDLKAALQRILDTFKDTIDYSRGIFLKPNIVFPVRESSGEITRLSFVKALISALKERCSTTDIVLGEGVAAGCDPQENFRVSGYTQLARKLNIPLLDLHTAERTALSWKYGTLDVPRIVLERTYINLPLLKPSSACVISGALKNQKGLMTPAVKKQFHRLGLHDQIAQLNAALRPALTIMDCSGFFGRNMLLSGNNCGEIDATACRLLGIEEPEHVHLSRSANVFTDGYSESGDAAGIRRTASRPHRKEFRQLGRLRLWSNPQACSMCRYLFKDLIQRPHRKQSLKVYMRLITNAVKGAEIIIGSNPQWRKEHKTVICVGECTRLIAQDGGYLHIPGCPPSSESLGKYLLASREK